MGSNKSLAKFFVVSALFFIWVTVQGALQAQQPVHEFLKLGPAGIIIGAHVHVGTLGWISMALIGTLYYIVPLVSGNQLSWPGLVNWVFWLETVFTTLMAVLMIAAGISGGNAVQAKATGEAINAAIGPYMMLIGVVSVVCGVVAILFAVQIIHTATKQAAR